MVHPELTNWLLAFHDPLTGKTLREMQALAKCTHEGTGLAIDITLGYPLGSSYVSSWIEALIRHLQQNCEDDAQISVKSRVNAHVNGAHVPALSNVKNLIAIGSGKGGVGKSSVTFQMALTLKRLGARVGVMDADVYGPSQPSMFGFKATKAEVRNGRLQPKVVGDIPLMSMGFLVGETAAMMWRGPMLSKALGQLLMDTDWPELDYLLIDLPPGTGDVQLTLCQKMPITAAVVVTTPQSIAFDDVTRACEMFRKLNVPMLGFVENMSTHVCDACGHESELFGHGSGEQLSKQYELPLLGKIPLNVATRLYTDTGAAFSKDAKLLPHQTILDDMAFKIMGAVACMPKDYSGRLPKITVEG